MKDLRIEFYITGEGTILPRVTSIKDIAHKIPLSRSGIDCRYAPKDFNQHDGHAPHLFNSQEKQDYINRVTRDILEAWRLDKTPMGVV